MSDLSRSSLKPAVAALIVLLSTLLGGCSRGLGYGVLLWSEDEEAFPSGSLVTIESESDIQDIYTFNVDGVEGTQTAARWRVDFYESRDEAASAAQEYSELATVYARATRNALPMRSVPELRSDTIVYRLRNGEVIKLISKDPEPTDLSGLVSYWYTALTTTGVRAYVFGYELDLFDPVDPEAEFDESGAADPLVQMLLGNVWRPVYFADMINDRAFDLELFRPEYGLFPDPDNGTFELVLPYHSTVFEYEQISNVGPRRYLATGTNLQITFNRGDELSLQYVHENEEFILALQRIAGEVQDYVDAELERRLAEFDRLRETGPAFSSGSYGKITLLDDQEFIWTGYERLVPVAIPNSIGTKGRILMDLYLGPELSESFEGAISFKFDGARDPVVFAYLVVPDGMRMMYVPPTDLEEYIVTGPGVPSITLFFSSSGG